MNPILEKYYVLDEGPGLKANFEIWLQNQFNIEVVNIIQTKLTGGDVLEVWYYQI